MTQPGTISSTRAAGDAIAGVLDAPVRVATTLAGSVATRLAGGCEVPPPCWEPQPAGTCSLELTPGTAATIRIHVSNCGWSHQVVRITALGKIAGWMTFTPTTLVLAPQERATILVTVHVPDALKPGMRFSAPVIVRGCRDHFVRVELLVSDCAGRNCCDVVVDDCADNVHHWYDHFYCPRPCRMVRDVKGTETRHG